MLTETPAADKEIWKMTVKVEIHEEVEEVVEEHEGDVGVDTAPHEQKKQLR